MASSIEPEINTNKQTRKLASTAPQEAERDEPTSAEPVVTGTALMARSFDLAERDRMVAEAAYYRAQHRGFEAGHELEDWLASEAEVDAALDRMYGEGRSF